MKLFFKIIIFILFLISLKLVASDKLTLQLKWKHQFQFAGFYMAKEKGFYKDLGIDLQIDELKSKNPVDSVLNKTYDFAIGDSTIIFDKMQNKDIVALFAIYQHSPLVLVGLKKNNFNHPNKLQNKIIEISPFSLGNIAIHNLLVNSGVSYISKKPTFNIDDLISGKSDLLSGYISNEPFRLKEKGYETTIIDPKDWGIDFYGDILFTSKKIIDERPELVDKFYKASLKGWIYAFENIGETVDVILKKYNTQNKSKESLLYEANSLKGLTGDLKDFGQINIEKIKYIASNFATKLDKKFNFETLNDFIYSDKIKNTINLSTKEKLFLKERNEFSICIQHNFYPFDGVKDGKIIGILGEYLSNISYLIDIKFIPIMPNSNLDLNKKSANGECDIISTVSPKSQRFNNITVTNDFIWDDFAIISSIKVPKLNIIKDSIKDKKFYVQFDVHKKLINLNYPELNINVLKNPDDIIKIIEKDRNAFFISLNLYAERAIQKYGFDKFKVNDVLNDAKIIGGLAVNNNYPELLTILNKTIKKLEEEKTFYNIRQRFMLKEYVINQNSKYLFHLITILSIILIITLYKYHHAKVEKLELQEKLNTELSAEKNALIQLNTAGIFHIKNRKFLWVNKKFNEMLGFEKDELIGKKTKKVYKKNSNNKYIGKEMILSLNKIGTFNAELVLTKKDSSNIIVDFSANAITTSKNQTFDKEIEFMGMIIDITDKKRQELELKELNETLEEKVLEQTKKLKEQALKDPLTNVFNRKAYNETIFELINDYKRYKTIFSMIFVDLDDFKKVNDEYGHHKGDEVLINFCKIVEDNIRVNDRLYRMGGEEFAILLPNTNLETAKFVAKKLLEMIRTNLKINNFVGITISGGLVEILDNDSPESLYKRVDELLYLSKNSGKDRIFIDYTTKII